MKLALVARPQIPPDVIKARAKAIKRMELAKGKETKKTLANSDKVGSKREKKVPSEQSPKNQDVKVTVTCEDMYAAEMDLYTTLEPYDISAEITCVVTFNGQM